MKYDIERLMQNIVSLTNEFLDLSTVVNILSIITSLITILGVLHAWRQRKLKIYTQYILNNIFIDRKLTLRDVSDAIRGKRTVINIYGKKGVGKSNFLRFFCDLTNHKLRRKDYHILKKQFVNKSEFKYLHLPRSKAFYLEISGYQSRNDLNSQISEIITGKSNFTNIEVAEKLRKAFIFHQRIIIIIDNVNTPGLETEIENIVKIFKSVSSKFYFIIGSTQELNLLGLLNVLYKNIELLNFGEKDIIEFNNRNFLITDFNVLADVLKLSEGLPILVNLYLKEYSKKGVLHNNIQVKKYIHEITSSLSSKELQIAQIIALLSITNTSISVYLLSSVIGDFNNDDIINLESKALIEYHSVKRVIKMHEIFRDYINTFYLIQNQEYILKLYLYFSNNSTEYERAYYAILANDINITNTIIPTVEKAISNENYSFLLLFGDHIKTTLGFHSDIENISKEAFYVILLGYIEGLVGVGDYQAAKEIIDKCELTIRDSNTLPHLKISLLVANLYHLQNQYQEAISSYDILIKEISKTDNGINCLKYEAKCLWGIAHSYRHEGLNYSLAELYYREAIKSAQTTNQRSIILKCHFELATMYMLQNNRFATDNEIDAIDKILKDLPSNQYIYTRIAYKKVRARYIRVFGINNLEDDFKLLTSVLEEYESQKKRLQYNTFFDIGEYFRHNGEYLKAIENYSIAYSFSKKNQDTNLHSMSNLGLILCDISLNINSKATITSLREILKNCINNNLYTNKVITELILDILLEGEISHETKNNLKYLGIYSKHGEEYCEFMDIKNIHLILM